MPDLRNERLEDHTSITAFPVSSALFAGTRSRSNEIAALAYSTTVVMTNAGEGWDQSSHEVWMPDLFP